MRTLTNLLPLALLFALAPSCGNSDTTLSTTGATIGLTDAASDELDMFEVDVKDITLTRLNGSSVSVMARTARVDFAQLETLTELMVGVSIPIGIYTNMSMTLDFSTAQVCLTGKTTPATILDPVGNQILGDVTVNVAFPVTARPQAIVGRNHLFLLDLDLNQSLAVDLPNNQVTFSPVATAEVDPSNPKPIFTTGILQSVDPASSTVVVERRTRTGTAIGTYAITVTPTTIYQIDGVNTVGAAGLNALAGVPADSRIFVQGGLVPQTRRLIAIAIETGNGIPGNGQDFVIGHIVGRDNGAGSNAALTVVGRSLDASSGVRQFNTSHTVNVDLSFTKVLKRLSAAGLSTDSLNVGQRVAVFGDLTGTTLDAANNRGVVRMLKTSVWGLAAGAPAGNTLTLNLTRIGLRPIGMFNFTVGGNPQGSPTAYAVDVTSLATTGITTGSKIRAVGFVNSVDAGGDDFMAESFVNHSTTASLLLCQWFPGTTAPFSSSTPTELTLDVSTAGIKFVGDGFGTSILSNSPTPAKIRALLAAGVYRIVQNGGVEMHFTFDSFVQSLEARVGQQSPTFRIAALGTFDAGTQTMSALIVSVILFWGPAEERAGGEVAGFRFKTIFGDRMRARGADAQAVEARLVCNILNQMTTLGRPESGVGAWILERADSCRFGAIYFWIG